MKPSLETGLVILFQQAGLGPIFGTGSERKKLAVKERNSLTSLRAASGDGKLPPESLKACGRRARVAYGVGDILVPQVILDKTGVETFVGQIIPC